MTIMTLMTFMMLMPCLYIFNNLFYFTIMAAKRPDALLVPKKENGSISIYGNLASSVTENHIIEGQG